MMTNLFTIFDPAVPYFIPLNWLSMYLFILMPTMMYWMSKNYYQYIMINMKNFMYYTLMPLNKKAPYNIMFMLITFFFIMMNNLPSNFSYIFPSTSHMSVTLSLSISFWLTTLIYSLKNNIKYLLFHMVPKGTPVILIPFMVIIETISLLIRPLTLGLRLAANMIAGHLLLSIVSNAYVYSNFLLQQQVPNLLNPLIGLEMAVAIIQAYVFVILISLYAEESNN